MVRRGPRIRRRQKWLLRALADHYAEAFSAQPGQCFRFVHNGVGHAHHCPESIVIRGQFEDGKGRRWKVDACAYHAEELEAQ
jgi:hypothetical protein